MNKYWILFYFVSWLTDFEISLEIWIKHWMLLLGVDHHLFYKSDEAMKVEIHI